MRKKDILDTNKYKIAILDDDNLMVECLEAHFRKIGYIVFASTNADELVDELRENKYDILILDCLLDGVSLDDLCNSIRSFDPLLHIILLTGYFEQYPPVETLGRLPVQNYCNKATSSAEGDMFYNISLQVLSACKVIEQNRNFEKSIGFKFKMIRESNEIKQEVLANELGITRQYLSGIENNTKMPTVELSMKFAQKFNLSLDWLLGNNIS